MEAVRAREAIHNGEGLSMIQPNLVLPWRVKEQEGQLDF